jgi:hypothetical protein
MSKRYYSVDEVDALVPELARRFETVMQLRSQLKSLYARLEEGGHPPGQTLPNGVDASIVRDRAVFDGMSEALRDEVTEIGRSGCVIRDIEIGLVDWLGVAGDGRDVWLCWRYGEREIGFFHEHDRGFRDRKPIAELAPTLPTAVARARAGTPEESES